MIIVDTVYQRVLALANKEQRGYITPQEFNLLANQAQMEIFEQYFYDQKSEDQNLKNSTEFSNVDEMLDEKLSIFKNTQALTVTGSTGTNQRILRVESSVNLLNKDPGLTLGTRDGSIVGIIMTL